MFSVERTSAGQARVTLVLAGILASDEYFARGVGTWCGERPRRFERYFGVHIPRSGDEVIIDFMIARRIALAADELDELATLRIRNITDGSRWGCGPAQLIALLVP